MTARAPTILGARHSTKRAQPANLGSTTVTGPERSAHEMPPAGLEPAPRGLKGRRSNQLSYRGERPS